MSGKKAITGLREAVRAATDDCDGLMKIWDVQPYGDPTPKPYGWYLVPQILGHREEKPVPKTKGET